MSAADRPVSALHVRSVWDEILAVVARECPASASLTTAQLLLWRTFARPDDVVEPEVGCSFERAHHGPHHAPLGAHEAAGELGRGDIWWLRWTDDDEHRELIDAPFCPATRAADDFCVKPSGHRRHHLWSCDLSAR